MTLEEDSGSETSSGEVRTNSEGSSSHSDIDESEEEEQPWTSEDLEKELEVLVGLDELKRHLRRWCKGLLLDRQRRKLGQ